MNDDYTIDVRILARSDAGTCCLRATSNSTTEAFWLSTRNCRFDPATPGIDPKSVVSVRVPHWLGLNHRQVAGDEAFEKAKQEKLERKTAMTTTNGNQQQNDYGPQVTLGILYEKKSKIGTSYLSGRLGMAKIAVLPMKEPAEDGARRWRIVLSEAPQKQEEAQPNAQAKVAAQAPMKPNNYALKDEIPFAPERR